MLDFYTLQETFKMLTESSNSEYTYTSADIATLCRQGALTPVFGYDSYISKPCHHEDDGRPLYAPCDTHKFEGHLTHDHLISLIDGYTDSLSLSVANSLEGERDILLFDRYQKNPQTAELGCITVTQKQIKIAAKEVQSYIASKQTTEQNTPEQQEIAKLKKKIEDLQKQLEERNDTPAGITPLKGLYKHNADKALFITTGQELAKYIWSMDTEQAIRTGDMVQQLKQVMNSIDNNLLPDDKAIRDWLSGIAPDYAKKSGKPPKDAPREISLIMRK